jgi:hypothetical protein
MAKRSKARSHSKALVPFRMSAPKPIVIRQTKIVKAKKHHVRHRSGGVGGLMRGLTDPARIEIVAAGAAIGFLQKSDFGKSLPKIPILGQAGTIALGAYFISDGGRNKLADRLCTAALTVAAYEIGNTGVVAGYEGGEYAPY